MGSGSGLCAPRAGFETMEILFGAHFPSSDEGSRGSSTSFSSPNSFTLGCNDLVPEPTESRCSTWAPSGWCSAQRGIGPVRKCP